MATRLVFIEDAFIVNLSNIIMQSRLIWYFILWQVDIGGGGYDFNSEIQVNVTSWRKQTQKNDRVVLESFTVRKYWTHIVLKDTSYGAKFVSLRPAYHPENTPMRILLPLFLSNIWILASAADFWQFDLQCRI
jgi:hypothetical protein